jgi:mannose/fructose/N-acetylgalactosamine-specific phosphotransferase system component IID
MVVFGIGDPVFGGTVRVILLEICEALVELTVGAIIRRTFVSVGPCR